MNICFDRLRDENTYERLPQQELTVSEYLQTAELWDALLVL